MGEAKSSSAHARRTTTPPTGTPWNCLLRRGRLARLGSPSRDGAQVLPTVESALPRVQSDLGDAVANRRGDEFIATIIRVHRVPEQLFLVMLSEQCVDIDRWHRVCARKLKDHAVVSMNQREETGDISGTRVVGKDDIVLLQFVG